MVVLGEVLVLDAVHLCYHQLQPTTERRHRTHLFTKSVDARVGGDLVSVVLGRQAAKDKRDRDHVLNLCALLDVVPL